MGAAMERLLMDLRYGIRLLIKQPGYAVIAVLTLALGIGATTAICTLIQGVLLSSSPYNKPEQLVLMPATRADGKSDDQRAWPSMQWMDWQKQAKSFQGVAGYTWGFNFLVRSEGSLSIEGMSVSPNFFDVLGLKPILGRTFLPTEGTQAANQVIVIGYDLWQNAFRGDPKVIGATMRISRRDAPITIVGVMGPGLRFLPSPGVAAEPNYDVNAHVDFWMPVVPAAERAKQPRWDVVGRLRPGATVAQAQSEMAVLTSQEARTERDFEGFVPKLIPLVEDANRDGRRILLPLLGAAILVFLIACGNAASLSLVRGLQRQPEYAVRTAVGVSRAALFRQVAAEGLVVALAGGVLGAGLAWGLVAGFKLVGGHAVPRLDAVTTGWPLFFWGLTAAITAGILSSLIPAFRASRFDPAIVLKSAGPNSSANTGHRNLIRAVTVAQTALTLALLVGAGLLIRTMMKLSEVKSGYETSRIVTMSVTAMGNDWAGFHQLALQRVSALPGVEGVAFAWGVPLTGNDWPAIPIVEGQPVPAKLSDRTILPVRAVTPGYFSLMRIGLLSGRDFRDTDTRDHPGVSIVNQAFVDRYFPGTNVLGRKLWWQDPGKEPSTEIIGVIENSRTDDLTRAAEPEIYSSFFQNQAFTKHLVVRSKDDPRAVMTSIRDQLRGIDPTVGVENMQTMDQIRDDSLASRTFAMQLLAGFAGIASILTLVGIYGVLSLSVANRRREIAIRAAVGAGRSQIRRLVFGEGARLVGAGIVAGVAIALLLSRALRAFLYEVTPTDPATLAVAVTLFAIVALAACWVPMRRAERVAPVEILRQE